LFNPKRITMKKTNLLILLASCLWLCGCYPKEDIYISDLDLVVTKYDPKASFSTKKTYAVPDSIVKLFTADWNDQDGNNMPDFLNDAAARQIIARVDANMTAYGYSKVTKNQSPDVTILLSVMESTNVYYSYDYYYWSWYYPYYWYYPYSVVPYSTSTSGTLLMMMMSNKEVNEADRVPVIWTGVINGILDGSGSSMTTRVNNSIDQAYKQSTYLKH
jgi:hypothetical protein